MSVQHANRGIVKKDLQLYYNREFSKSFRGEATSNLANTVSIGAQGGSLTVATTYPSFSEDLSTGNYFKNFPNGGVLYHLVTNPAFSDNASLYNNNGGLTGATSIPIAGTYLIFSFYVYLTQIYTGYAGGLGGYINVNTNSGGNGSIGSALTSYGWTFYVNGVADNGWSSNTANLNKWIRITAFVNNGAISSSAKYFSNWYIYSDRLTSGSMYIAKFQIEQKTYITNPVSYDILTNLSNRGETTTNLISNPDFTSTSNWANNQNVTLSTLTVGAKTYLKVVSNQGSSSPGILSDAIAVTAGNVYTLSAYAYRSGSEAYLYVLNVTTGSDIIWTGQSAAALGSTEGWRVNKFTVPAGCTSIKVGILFNGPTIGDTFYVEKMQLEQREYQSAFVNGSRTTNTLASGGGLLDMSGNNVNADLTNVSFNNTGYFFNGASSNRIIAKTYTATDPFWLNLGSISIWFKTSTNQNGVLVGWGDDGSTNFGSIEITADWTGSYADESLIAESYTASASQRAVIRKGSNYYANGVWTNITAVFDDNYLNLKIYINGVLETTSNNGSSSGAPFLNVSTSTSYFNIGRRTYGAGSEYFTGEIGQTMVYGRLLTAAEVLQNFNATRKTYGI